ncbi:MAG: ribosome maturation factor RimP, partial [Xanthomonadaceae bacterium]|nr:ribosome maturation factor RimP [Xanthomonadaceae bacterium]
MNDKANEIFELLTPIVQSMGLELLGIELLPGADGALLRLYIDVLKENRENGAVTIEDCEKVSHEVSAQLDVTDPIQGHYTLEVSSPGVDRPLFTVEQFADYCGSSVKVTLRVPQNGRRRLQGEILKVEDQTIVLSVNDEEIAVALTNIDKARLIPDWAAMG